MVIATGKFSAAKRRQKRIKMVLAVRLRRTGVNGHSTEQLVHTLDITVDGVRIGGLHERLENGEKVVIQRGPMKRPFRVAWVSQMGLEYRAGLVALQELRDFWRLDLPEEPDEYYGSPQ